MDQQQPGPHGVDVFHHQSMHQLAINSNAFYRWRQVAAGQCLKTDTDVACFLLQSFEKTQSCGPAATFCSICSSPLTLCCPNCDLTPQRNIAAPSPVKLEPPARNVISNPEKLIPVKLGPVEKTSWNGSSFGPARIRSVTGDKSLNAPGVIEARVPGALHTGSDKLVWSELGEQTSCFDNADFHTDESGDLPCDSNNPKEPVYKISDISGDMLSDVDGKNIPVSFGAATEKKTAAKRRATKKPKTYVCKYCSAEFAQVWEYKQHLSLHTGQQRPHSCHFCPASFVRVSDLNRHTLNCHSSKASDSCLCQYCSAKFGSVRDLERHLLTHKGEKPFVCNICDAAFSFSYSLGVHMKCHNGGRNRTDVYRCKTCKMTFETFSDLTVHLQTHGQVRQYSCNICGAGLKTSTALKLHMARHTDHRPYSCTQCDMSFKTTTNLRRHEKLHNRVLFHTCNECNVPFLTAAALNKHKNAHEKMKIKAALSAKKKKLSAPSSKSVRHRVPRPSAGGKLSTKSKISKKRTYVCAPCSLTFMSHRAYKKHFLETHNAHECGACGKQFRHVRFLERHYRVHSSEKPYSCSRCTQSFAVSDSLTHHMNAVHSHSASFKCEECDAAFPFRYLLNGHIKSKHQNIRNHTCKDCGATFKTRSHLGRHLKMHESKEEMFACEECFACFNSDRSLRVHKQRIHKSNKKFQCEVCGKHLGKKRLLIDHMRIHTGEKPHLCEICGASFTWDSSLTYHMSTHTSKKHVCQICGSGFVWKSELAIHMEIHEKEEVKSENSENILPQE